MMASSPLLPLATGSTDTLLHHSSHYAFPATLAPVSLSLIAYTHLPYKPHVVQAVHAEYVPQAHHGAVLGGTGLRGQGHLPCVAPGSRGADGRVGRSFSAAKGHLTLTRLMLIHRSNGRSNVPDPRAAANAPSAAACKPLAPAARSPSSSHAEGNYSTCMRTRTVCTTQPRTKGLLRLQTKPSGHTLL